MKKIKILMLEVNESGSLMLTGILSALLNQITLEIVSSIEEARTAMVSDRPDFVLVHTRPINAPLVTAARECSIKVPLLLYGNETPPELRELQGDGDFEARSPHELQQCIRFWLAEASLATTASEQ